jgi:tight adherence protein C
MDLISTLVFAAAIYFIITEFFMNEDGDDSILRRLLEYSPAKLKEKESKEKEPDSIEFIRQSINSLAQNIASKSKNVLAQKQILVEAGMPGDDESYLNHVSKKLVYSGFCGIAGLFFAIISPSAPIIKIMMIFMFPLIGFRLPDMKVKNIAKKRATEITYSLPDSIDLLTVCVEAGLGLDSALTRVATEQQLSSPILSEELKRVGKDILAGVPRTDAFKNLSRRNASPELRSFVALLIQSDKLGTSIAQSLKIYSDSLRNKRKQKAEQQAAQASIKMTIPLVLFILPATFIVILAPAALSIVKVFMGGALK